MITSTKEMSGDIAGKEVIQSIFACGANELALWKRCVKADPRLFDLLYNFIYSDDPRLAMRSCWIIDNASEEFPDLLSDKLPELISTLISTKNGSLKRHFTRILCRYQIPEQYLAAVINRSFELLAPTEPISVRVFAMQLLFNITRQVPDLRGELILVIESLMEVGGSAGFTNRAGKLIRQLRSQ
jgi:hypothetical protein